MVDVPGNPIRILIIEDEAIIAMTTEDMAEDLGHQVVAIAATLGTALAAVDAGGFDLALLDINLNGEPSMPVAARLQAAGVPFVFTTGYGSAGPDGPFADAPLLAKPYRSADLANAIAAAIA